MNLESIANKVSREMIEEKTPIDNPVVIALVGLQYSGKSTLATQIANHNFAHFWATKIKKDYSLANEEMITVSGFVIKRLIEEGFSVVMDYVNQAKIMRESLHKIARDSGAGYELVYLDIPKEERLRRRSLNEEEGETPGRRLISLDQMQSFEDNFETPEAYENPIILRDQNDIDNFLKSL